MTDEELDQARAVAKMTLTARQDAASDAGVKRLREGLKKAAIDLLLTPRHNGNGVSDKHIEESRNRIRDLLYPEALTPKPETSPDTHDQAIAELVEGLQGSLLAIHSAYADADTAGRAYSIAPYDHNKAVRTYTDHALTLIAKHGGGE